ncbi:tetratricopeptide repeat protein [Candidatus Daviesbacteria bacterium]|nr:tetratricopeptide repeat protein [Candidatus Daviesbacteria bacterium]
MDAKSSPNSLNLSQLAIEAALNSSWQDALKLNKKILKVEPQNVDALARLARVNMELGKFNLAKKFYSEVLKYDPYNPIAIKNLKIIKSFKSNNQNLNRNGSVKLSPSLFLQEPGKTKVVSLLKVAEPQKLSQTFCGMKVEIVIKNRKITITDFEGKYLGVLPDDVSYHLLRLIKGGNKYELFIKSIKVNGLAVLIRETFRSKRFKNQASFLGNLDVVVTTDLITAVDDPGDSVDSASDEEVIEEAV